VGRPIWAGGPGSNLGLDEDGEIAVLGQRPLQCEAAEDGRRLYLLRPSLLGARAAGTAVPGHRLAGSTMD
jgi:hypothetical protein